MGAVISIGHVVHDVAVYHSLDVRAFLHSHFFPVQISLGPMGRRTSRKELHVDKADSTFHTSDKPPGCVYDSAGKILSYRTEIRS